MTPAAAYKAIYQAWILNWHTLAGGTQAAPTVPYGIDNRKITQPEGAFASVEITNLSSDQATMGPEGRRRFERAGFIDVRLFGPRNQGRGALDTLAEYVRDIYESTRIGAVGEERGVVTLAMTTTEVRNGREFPDMWCLLCRTPFWYHEKR
jgi:hypothetical protein